MSEGAIPFMMLKDKRLFDGQDIWVIIKRLGNLDGLYYAEVYVKKFVVSDLSVIKELVRQRHPNAKRFKVSSEWGPVNMMVRISFQNHECLPKMSLLD